MIHQAVKYHVLNSTFLLKGSSSTNFIYRIDNVILNNDDIKRLNALDFDIRFELIVSKGGIFKFIGCKDKIFHSNLIMVDSTMPAILSEVVLLNYSKQLTEIKDIAKLLIKINPLSYSSDFGRINIYDYKLREFLRNLIFGMNPENIWHGEPNLYEHMPVLKINNEIIYYSDSAKVFNDLLYTQSRVGRNDNISKGEIYIRDGKYFISLNLQVDLKT